MTQPQNEPQLDRRALAIAAIYAYAAWLVANPDVPVPTAITCNDHRTQDLGRAASIAAAQILVDRHGAVKKRAQGAEWARAELEFPGLERVTHTIFIAEPTPEDHTKWL